MNLITCIILSATAGAPASEVAPPHLVPVQTTSHIPQGSSRGVPGVSVGMSYGLTTASLDASLWLDERLTLDARLGGAGNGDAGGVGLLFGATHHFLLRENANVNITWTLSGAAGIIEEFCIFCSGPADSATVAEGTTGLSFKLWRFLEFHPEAGVVTSDLFGVLPVARLSVSIGNFGR
ncbi:MAG: hypothetical protein AAFU77_08955 [Myxococcota bacterium]